MILLSELQVKEVIMIEDGRRMGHISDLEIDADQGRIVALVLMDRDKKTGFFGKADEVLIYWEHIVTIGSDVILVKNLEQPHLFSDPSTFT